MTDTSREQFEATFSDEMHTKVMWECWQESRRALEAEQAQAQQVAVPPLDRDAVIKEIEQAIVDHCTGGDLWMSANLAAQRIEFAMLAAAPQGDKL